MCQIIWPQLKACHWFMVKMNPIFWIIESLFIKSVKNNVQFSPVVKSLIDVEVLSDILQPTTTLPHPAAYQSLYLFCFFSFLRISNILPHTIASFDWSRHLARGDMIFGPQQATVILKWSKTMQDRQNIKIIYISVLVLLHSVQWPTQTHV